MIVDKPLKIYDGCLIDGVIWGYSNYLKAIVAIDAQTYMIVKIIDIYESAGIVYKKIAYFEGSLYVFPAYGSKILKYSINNKKVVTLTVDGHHMISTADVIRKGNCLYIIPCRLDTPFFQMDLKSEKKIIINKWNNFVTNLLRGETYFSTTSFLYNDVIFTPCTYTKMVILYDTKQCTVRNVNLNIINDTIFSLTGYQERIYLSGNHRDKIYMWNVESMELQEMAISDINISRALYYRMYVEDNNLFLFPNRSDAIKRIQLDNSNEISEFVIPITNYKLCSVLLYGMIRTEKKLIMLPLVMGCFFVFDLDKNLWQQFSVDVICTEIRKYPTLLKPKIESVRYNLMNFIRDVGLNRNGGKMLYSNEEQDCVGENVYKTCKLEQNTQL